VFHGFGQIKFVHGGSILSTIYTTAPAASEIGQNQLKINHLAPVI